MQLTLENVLARIDQFEVMQRYFGEPVIMGKKYLNPFREDSCPRCFFRMQDHKLLFCDYASPYWGDCVQITALRLGTTLYPALQVLNKEYNLGLDCSEILLPASPVINHIPTTLKEKPKASIVFQRYEDFADDDYFYGYNISKSTLNHFNVIPLHKVWVTGKRTEVFTSTITQPIYAYWLGDEDYKIYRPLSKIENKWRSNCDKLQGFTGDTDDLVIRTSSLKDVMVLHECGYLADAPQCENAYAKKRDNMILLYDNDKAGKALTKLHSEYYNCGYFFMPEIYVGDKQLKDPSDISKYLGLDYLKQYIEECLIKTNIYTQSCMTG
jgi:hypothetical protein